jgi:hypothetical protein
MRAGKYVGGSSRSGGYAYWPNAVDGGVDRLHATSQTNTKSNSLRRQIPCPFHAWLTSQLAHAHFASSSLLRIYWDCPTSPRLKPCPLLLEWPPNKLQDSSSGNFPSRVRCGLPQDNLPRLFIQAMGVLKKALLGYAESSAGQLSGQIVVGPPLHLRSSDSLERSGLGSRNGIGPVQPLTVNTNIPLAASVLPEKHKPVTVLPPC